MADGTILDVNQIKEAFAKGGLAKVHEYIENKSNEWKQIPINIALTGKSGVGKSAFINAFRNVTRNDPEFAEEDVIETTKKPTPYEHPEHHNLVLWDLPGVGTDDFPKEQYLNKIVFQRYDFFLILSANRVFEDDTWLAKQVQEKGKQFFFVHTQTDIDILKRTDIPADKVVEKIRNDCIKRLTDSDVSDASNLIYLINNKDTSAFDFDRLTAMLLDAVPPDKRDAFALSMTMLTERVILAKREALRGKIYLAAIASAATAAIPIPGIGVAVDTAVLLRQVNEYRKQFGLDDLSLEKLGEHFGTSSKNLARQLQLTSTTFWGANGIFLVVKTMAGRRGGKVPTLLMPLLGSVVTAGISYTLCSDALHNMLDEITEDALKVHREFVRAQREKMNVKSKI